MCTHEHCVCCISVSAPCLETSVMNYDCRSNAVLAAVTTFRPKGTSGLRETCCLKGRSLQTLSRLLFLNVCMCVCLHDYNVLQSTELLADCCILIVSPSINIQVVSAHVWSVCVPFQVVLTVPMRWPALRAHTKVPAPCNMVLMTDWGALSWSLMVWLTVGMYGNSITESKQAIFTDTPVTVPARCL